MQLNSRQLLRLFSGLGACHPGLDYFRRELSKNPDIDIADVWNSILKLRRTPEEMEAEKAMRKEDPDWKSDPEKHTGWAWLAWVARHVAQVPCSTGTFSGRRKTFDGPNVDALDPHEVYQAICTRVSKEAWVWLD